MQKREHAMLTRVREGYYDTNAFRKYVDRMLHTFQSKRECQAELHKLKATWELQLVESVKFLTALEPTATRAGAESKGEDQAGSPKTGNRPRNVEKGYASLPTRQGSLKEMSFYGDATSQLPPNSVPPGQPPTRVG
jgi:hypothetical protein